MNNSLKDYLSETNLSQFEARKLIKSSFKEFEEKGIKFKDNTYYLSDEALRLLKIMNYNNSETRDKLLNSLEGDKIELDRELISELVEEELNKDIKDVLSKENYKDFINFLINLTKGTSKQLNLIKTLEDIAKAQLDLGFEYDEVKEIIQINYKRYENKFLLE